MWYAPSPLFSQTRDDKSSLQSWRHPTRAILIIKNDVSNYVSNDYYYLLCMKQESIHQFNYSAAPAGIYSSFEI